MFAGGGVQLEHGSTVFVAIDVHPVVESVAVTWIVAVVPRPQVTNTLFPVALWGEPPVMVHL